MITADREKSRRKVRRNDDRVNAIENMSGDSMELRNPKLHKLRIKSILESISGGDLLDPSLVNLHLFLWSDEKWTRKYE